MKFLLGLLSGAIAGLLLAPARGSETRRRITQGANDLAQTSREKAQQVADATRRKARDVSNMASEKVQQASEVAKQKAGDIGRTTEAATDAIAEDLQRKTA